MDENISNEVEVEEFELPEDFDEYCAYVGSKEWEEDYFGGFND